MHRVFKKIPPKLYKPDLNDLHDKIITWAEEKGITEPERINRQYLKLVEEVGELAAGLAREDKAQIKDAMGDVFVVLTILAKQAGFTLEEAVTEVYDIISKRTGKTVDGVFIKDEDIKR